MKVTQQPITTKKMAGNQKDKPIKVIPTVAKTLINNDSCVVAATKFPWWIALIVYILSFIVKNSFAVANVSLSALCAFLFSIL